MEKEDTRKRGRGKEEDYRGMKGGKDSVTWKHIVFKEEREDTFVIK